MRDSFDLVLELISRNICVVCGRKNCPYDNNVDYQKMQEAYLKGDFNKLKIIYVQKFAQQFRANRSNLEKALKKDQQNSTKSKVYNSIDLYQHYRSGSRKDLMLSDIGLSDKVRPLVIKNKALGKETSVQSAFISQVKKGERISFSNSYPFGKEANLPIDPLWAIGSAKLEGRLSNVKAFPHTKDTYLVSANIDYEFTDKFTDPYDTFNLVGGEWNPDGEPYYLKDRWSNKVNFEISRNVYEQKLLSLLGNN